VNNLDRFFASQIQTLPGPNFSLSARKVEQNEESDRMAQQGKQTAKKNNERVFQSHISNLPGATQAVINT